VSQREAAYRFGRDQTFISKLETGKRWMTFAEVEKLAGMYGRQLADFGNDIPPVRRYRPNS
jgi:hypothetical protein